MQIKLIERLKPIKYGCVRFDT